MIIVPCTRAHAPEILPVLGAFDLDGALAGFATYGPFRSLPAYRYTVEHSVYAREDRRGRCSANSSSPRANARCVCSSA